MDTTKPQEIDYQKDIRNTDLRDIIAENNAWEDDQWSEEKKQTVTPPVSEEKEPKITTPPVEAVKPPDTTPPVSKEAEKPVLDEAKLTETLTENITKKLVEQFSPSDTTKEEKKDIETKIKELQAKATEEGRELTYQEAIKFVKDEVSSDPELRDQIKKEIMADLNKEVESETKKAQEEKARQEKETKEQNDRLYSEWDRQIGVLQQQGFPKVLDKTDPNDPGMRAQKQLFEALNAINKEQQKNGQPVSLNLVEAYVHPIYKQITEQPGKDAPVNGMRKSVASNEKVGLNYQKDIHGADLRDIISEMYQSS
jgi:hypothetical protein